MCILQDIELNTKVHAYPIPRIIDLIDQLSQANFLSTLDLTKGIGRFLLWRRIERQPLLHRLVCMNL